MSSINKKLSRRSLLKFTGMASGALLAACAAPAAPAAPAATTAPSATTAAGATEAPAASPTEAPAATGDTIKVGILHSLSGTMSISEVSVKDATQMAIDEINAAGGVMGKKLEAIA